ncbi:tetratricopeptide repeat protein, partial [Streptomyces sp. NPDC005921]
MKHFAVNNQETDRMRVSADVDERTLREIYLPAFEHIVTEAAPATVMAAYNKVNGVHAAQNRWLLTEVLRDEWGFTGAVVSDWGAVHGPVASVRAGLDLEMPGPSPENARRIVDAVRDGELDERVVDMAVRRIAALAGLAGGQSDETDGSPESYGFDADAHHRLARKLAAECAVLLRNEDRALPLASAQRIAVIGEFAATPRYQAGGSSHLNPTRLDNALDAIRESAAVHGSTVEFAPGFTLDGSGDAAALREAALAAARSSDVAVVFAGLAESAESEGFDRDDLCLPADTWRLFGPDHLRTRAVRLHLAIWRGEAGDPVGATIDFEHLLADQLRVLGDDHPQTLSTRHDLARWRGRSGDPRAAVADFEHLLADQLRVLGPDHPDTLTTRHDLASWRGEGGKPHRAVDDLESVLVDRLRVLGPDHPDTLTTRANLAYWRGKSGDPAGAVVATSELLAERLRVLGPDHPDTLTTRHNLAQWKAETGDAAGAVVAESELLADRLRVLGPDHPHTFSARHHLAQWIGQRLSGPSGGGSDIFRSA